MPPHYIEVNYLKLTAGRTFFWLNLLSLVVLIIAGLIFSVWLVFYYGVLGGPLALSTLPETVSPPATALLLVGMLLLHELCHGIGIQYYGHRARYGFRWVLLYATTDTGYFWRRQMIVVALLPLVLVSVLAIVLTLVVPPGIGVVLSVVAATNAAGAVGDLWLVWKALQFPPHALFEDEEDSMRVFLPEDFKNRSPA